MWHHQQEGLAVETTAMMTIVAHEMDIVEAKNITQAAELIPTQVVMNVMAGKEFIHLLIGSTLSVGADRNKSIHLWIGCIRHLVNHTVGVQGLGALLEVVEKADMKVEADTKSLSLCA